MENQNKQNAFSFIKYFVSESHITFDETKEISDEFNISIKPSGIKDKDIFKLKLETHISDKHEAYTIFVSMTGLFKFEEIENISSFFTLNAPAIMFPYIRSYISSLTSISGVDTVIIPTLNLSSLKEELEKSIEIL